MMEMNGRHNPVTDDDESSNSGPMIILRPLCLIGQSPSLDLRVFYVRVRNCVIDESTAEHLTVSHIPLIPGTIREVNGTKCSTICSGYVSSLLRSDWADRRSEEAVFVSTDSIGMTASVRFEVFDGDDMLLTRAIELCDGNGYVGESENRVKRWGIRCRPAMPAGSGLLKGKRCSNLEMQPSSPVIEVYVAGCFSGTPVILTEALQLAFQEKHQKLVPDAILKYETSELQKEESYGNAYKISDCRDHKAENDLDIDDDSIYSRPDYTEGEEEEEHSWFTAGARVGVGIGLGICIGIGIGVGILVRMYQATTRNFKMLN